MKLVWLVIVACIALAGPQSHSVLVFSDSRYTVAAFTSSGEISLPAAHLQLDLTYPDGKTDCRDLSFVYDPRNRHHSWWLAEASAPAYTDRFLEDLESHKVYADADGIVDFVSIRGVLGIQVSRSQAASLEAAERAAIGEIEQHLESAERGYLPPTPGLSRQWPWDSKVINLREAIPLEFSCGFPLRDNCEPGLDTVVSIGRQGHNWRLVLRNHWDQEIVLGAGFQLVSSRRVR
ncbi:MAG: hypothetical protein ABSH49_36250 [Bryobacteraceae bacterium]